MRHDPTRTERNEREGTERSERERTGRNGSVDRGRRSHADDHVRKSYVSADGTRSVRRSAQRAGTATPTRTRGGSGSAQRQSSEKFQTATDAGPRKARATANSSGGNHNPTSLIGRLSKFRIAAPVPVRKGKGQVRRDRFVQSSSKRLAIFSAVFLVLMSVVVVRLFTLQGVDTDRYRQLGDGQRVRRVDLLAPRGDIIDRNGRSLAVSRQMQSIFANAREVKDPDGVAAKLAPLVADDKATKSPADQSTLAKRLSADKGFVWLQRKVSDDTAEAVKALKIPGISMSGEPSRLYPAGKLAGSILGFADIDNKGLAGLEQSQNSTLTGQAGIQIAEKDPKGREIPSGVYRVKEPVPGRGLKLTLDMDIQYEAESALAEAINAYQAKGGVAAIMDPKTGDLLALAIYPGYDPNDPGKSGAAALQSLGVGSVFEPGSVSKIVTISGALETGIVTPETSFTVPDNLSIGNHTFRDNENHATEEMRVRKIIAHSSNVGTIKVAEKLGEARFYEFMKKFGYGEKTGIELPAESRGIAKAPPNETKWYPTDLPSMAMGHSVAVTPLQMLRVMGTVANGGVMLQPRLIDAVTDVAGEKAVTRPEGQRVISETTAASMREMLTQVVSEGTAPLAAVPGYWVGGKTGTARKPIPGGGYDRSSHFASFIGMLPADNPRAVGLVVLDDPTPVYGGLTAAPTFSRIMSFVMRALRVPPAQNQQVVTNVDGSAPAAPAPVPAAVPPSSSAPKSPVNSTVTTVTTKPKPSSSQNRPPLDVKQQH